MYELTIRNLEQELYSLYTKYKALEGMKREQAKHEHKRLLNKLGRLHTLNIEARMLQKVITSDLRRSANTLDELQNNVALLQGYDAASIEGVFDKKDNFLYEIRLWFFDPVFTNGWTLVIHDMRTSEGDILTSSVEAGRVENSAFDYFYLKNLT